jgi:antitoxin CptB
VDDSSPQQSAPAYGNERDADRLAWRCRRGLLELDLWLGGFWAAHRATLAAHERAAFERLLNWSDMEILDSLKSPRASGDPALDSLVQRIHATRPCNDQNRDPEL